MKYHDNDFLGLIPLAETEVAMTTVITSHVKDKKSYFHWI